jgi:hypothetical protein
MLGQAIRLYILVDVVNFSTEVGEFIGETNLISKATANPKERTFASLHRFN